MSFTIIAAVVQKTRILWAMKWENTLQKQPRKVKESNFQKTEINAFFGTFPGFLSQL